MLITFLFSFTTEITTFKQNEDIILTNKRKVLNYKTINLLNKNIVTDIKPCHLQNVLNE